MSSRTIHQAVLRPASSSTSPPLRFSLDEIRLLLQEDDFGSSPPKAGPSPMAFYQPSNPPVPEIKKASNEDDLDSDAESSSDADASLDKWTVFSFDEELAEESKRPEQSIGLQMGKPTK
jgi:hypothetical protein